MGEGPRLNIKIREEIIEGEEWSIIILEDNGIGWDWDDMPVEARGKYLLMKKKVELLGGEFYYENVPKEGAKTTIKLPSYILGRTKEERMRKAIEEIKEGAKTLMREMKR